MTAYFESGYTVRQPAWHGLATVLDDYPENWEKAREYAGLTWDPVAEPVYARRLTDPELMNGITAILENKPEAERAEALAGLFGGALQELDGFQRTYRSDDYARTLGTMTTDYQPITHAEFGEIIEAVLQQANVRYETAGSVEGGRKTWALALLDEPIQIPGDASLSLPYLALTARHDGAGGVRLQDTSVRVVCHAADTPIIDADWRGLVQHHPSFRKQVWREGRQVTVRGLPFPEQVSEEHRYWVRERRRSLTPARRRKLGIAVTRIGQDRDPGWVHARDLKPVIHEIGYRIDTRENPPPGGLSGTETAWVLGYAWGNGNLHGDTNQITLSVPSHRPALIGRITAFAQAHGWAGKPQQRTGCVQITFAHPALRRALAEFTRGGAWSQKCPPGWAETAPLDWQRSLIQGYYDADGSADTKEGCILASVSLDGLLSMRRILARLGIPSSIRAGGIKEGTMQIQGRTVQVQQSYTIRFWVNVAQLGYETRFQGKFSHPSIEDGYLWSRVEEVTGWAGMVCPITTGTSEYLTGFGVSHNCANTIAMAEAEADARGAVFTFTHSRNWREHLAEARDAIAGVRGHIAAYKAWAQDMLGIRISSKQEERFVVEFVPVPPDALISDRVARNVEQARAAVRGFLASPTVEGAGIRGTGYGLVQAGVEYLDWYRRSRNQSTRFDRQLLKPDRLKAETAALVLEIAKG